MGRRGFRRWLGNEEQGTRNKGTEEQGNLEVGNWDWGNPSRDDIYGI
jgi:hypothetical protein